MVQVALALVAREVVKTLRDSNMEDALYTIENYSLDDEGVVWVHAFPYRTYDHPTYGEITFTEDDAVEMKQNFENNVLERKVAWNYAHKKDRAKGDKAAGWVQAVEVREDGAWVAVEPTETAAEEIKKGEWRYSSVERLPEWTHDSTGEKFKNVLFGGALTNYPFLKGVAPLNFSDFDLVERKEEHSDDNDSNEHSEEGIVDLKDLATQLGLPEDSDEATVKAKVQEFADVARKAAEHQTLEDDGKPKGTVTVEEEVKQEFGDIDPAIREELVAGRTFRRDAQAQKFADDIRSEKGAVLAPKYNEQVKKAYLDLENGDISMTAFSETMVEATTKGMVALDEIGSTGGPKKDDSSNDQDATELVEQFSEEFLTLTTGDDALSREKALAKIGKEKPELLQAYSEMVGGGV